MSSSSRQSVPQMGASTVVQSTAPRRPTRPCRRASRASGRRSEDPSSPHVRQPPRQSRTPSGRSRLRHDASQRALIGPLRRARSGRAGRPGRAAEGRHFVARPEAGRHAVVAQRARQPARRARTFLGARAAASLRRGRGDGVGVGSGSASASGSALGRAGVVRAPRSAQATRRADPTNLRPADRPDPGTGGDDEERRRAHGRRSRAASGAAAATGAARRRGARSGADAGCPGTAGAGGVGAGHRPPGHSGARHAGRPGRTVTAVARQARRCPRRPAPAPCARGDERAGEVNARRDLRQGRAITGSIAGEGRAPLRDARRVGVDVAQRALVRVPGVGRDAGEERDEHAAEGVDVGPRASAGSGACRGVRRELLGAM